LAGLGFLGAGGQVDGARSTLAVDLGVTQPPSTSAVLSPPSPLPSRPGLGVGGAATILIGGGSWWWLAGSSSSSRPIYKLMNRERIWSELWSWSSGRSSDGNGNGGARRRRRRQARSTVELRE